MSSNKGDAKPPDRESLMALHALLQIRSESAASEHGTAEGQGAKQEDEQKHAKPVRKRAKKVSRIQPCAQGRSPPTTQSPTVGGPSSGQMRSLSASVSFGQSECVRQSLKSLQNINQHPLHGFLNMAAAPSPMNSNAAQLSAAISALMQPSPISINQRFITSQLRPESEMLAQFTHSSAHGMQSKEQFPPPSTPRFSGRDLVASVEGHSSKAKDFHGITPATSPSPSADELIRREEVEAALKSKPQRGRKRENLSVLERLELTRTRNREHAKSTRIRKKQRYQELVDNERRLQELQSAEDLNLQRQDSAMNFVKIREQMLNNFHGESAESSNEEETQKASSVSIKRGSVSFGDLQDPVENSGGANEEVRSENKNAPSDRAVALNDVIDNLSTFSFNASQLCTSSWVRPEGVHALTGVTMMKRFDNSVVSLLQQHFNDAVVPTLRYRVEGSFDGIAVNAHGKGYARVDLVLEGDEGRPAQTLVSSILTMQFAADSDKLTAVEWSVFQDRLSSRPSERERHGGQDSRSDSGESLGSQTVYPSVVSLDHNMSSSASDTDNLPKMRPTDVDEGQGPGMHI